MKIENLNKLIAHLEAQPPERINMGRIGRPECGSPGCLMGHSAWVLGDSWLCDALGISEDEADALAGPEGWQDNFLHVQRRYPASRVISTLKRIRNTYLSTGQVVVDWGPEPGEEPKQVWTAPQVAEVISPALPAELTSLLRNTVEA